MRLLLKTLKLDELIRKDDPYWLFTGQKFRKILPLSNETDRLTLVQLFVKLDMGSSKQKRFFPPQTRYRFSRVETITSYLQKGEILEILNHQEMKIPQKMQHFGNLLKQAISPASLLAEEPFVRQVAGLQLPTNHSNSHSPSFEKDEVTLSITFKVFAACVQYLSQQQQ